MFKSSNSLFNTQIKTVSAHLLLIFLLFITCVFSVKVSAHEPSSINMPSQLLLKSAISIQDKSLVDDGQAWLIPGVMLGGESVPLNQGAGITDLQLFGRYNLEDSFYLGTKVGFHQHQGEGEFDLENYWIGKYLEFDGSILKIDFGKMATEVTPIANHHASEDEFNTKTLLAEVFFGGHHKDTGIKANWYWQTLELGLELWNGDNWPYNSTKGNVSAFARYHGFNYGIKTDIAMWYSSGEAQQRIDNRYDSGHSHSAITTTAPDVNFSGDIKRFGSYILLSHQVTDDFIWMAQWEWIHDNQEGVIADSTQSALIDQSLDGYRLMAGVTWQRHGIFIQQELLAVNNKFTDATPTFIEQQGLFNDGIEPQRFTLGYHWRWNDSFTLRIESIDDQTQSNKNQHYFSVGLNWQHKLL